MKWIVAVLVLLFIALQARLWVGEGSLAATARLQRNIEQQRADNDRLRERNRVLAIEVEELKSGLDSVEERARTEMGMIKKGETFYMVVETEEQ